MYNQTLVADIVLSQYGFDTKIDKQTVTDVSKYLSHKQDHI